MKLLRIIVTLSVFTSFAFSYCVYVDCSMPIQSSKTDSKMELERKFQEVKKELEQLEKSYQKKLEELSITNETLRKQIALSKNTLLEFKELIFLLKQRNQIEGNVINQEAVTNEKNIKY